LTTEDPDKKLDQARLEKLVSELTDAEALKGLIKSQDGQKTIGLAVILQTPSRQKLNKLEKAADFILPLSRNSSRLLESIRELIVRNRAIEEKAFKDPLTSLINFRQFMTQLKIEMDRVKRTERPCSLMMIDLDHFKPVNDNHGHQAGNSLLVTVAMLIRSKIRTVDVAARYGGDEFTVIMPNTSIISAAKLAERIRRSLETDESLSRYGVTASFGLSDYHHRDDKNLEDFIEHSDLAMYEAKRAGGNRVCLYKPDWEKAGTSPVSAEEKQELAGSLKK